jgi:hypothetical protein
VRPKAHNRQCVRLSLVVPTDGRRLACGLLEGHEGAKNPKRKKGSQRSQTSGPS